MSDLLTPQTVVVAVLTGVAVATSWRDMRRFAFAWALVLPIDVVTGVPGWVFDGLRYAGAAWIVLRVPADLPPASRGVLRTLAGLLLALAAVRTGMAMANHDDPGVRFGLMMTLGAVIAYLVILRTTVHRALIGGYLAGVALSATVSLQQALGWATLAPANRVGSRYPGLSTYTTVFTWHVATAFIVGCYLIAANARARNRVFWLACAATPLYTLGLLTNGAQGGLLGVIVAAGAMAWAGRSRITRTSLIRAGVAAAAAVVLVGLAAGVGGVDIPSVNDYDRSFHNEKTRVESWQAGAREMLNHPVTGLKGRTYLVDRGHRIVPHFLPLESGALAGIAGFVAASAVVGYTLWLVVRGPADRRGETIVAYGLLASLLVNILTTPQGPFQGVARTVPLFLIVLHASVRDRTAAPAAPTASTADLVSSPDQQRLPADEPGDHRAGPHPHRR